MPGLCKAGGSVVLAVFLCFRGLSEDLSEATVFISENCAVMADKRCCDDQNCLVSQYSRAVFDQLRPYDYCHC